MIWYAKMQPSQEISSLSSELRLPRKMHLCRSSSNLPRLPSFLKMLQHPHVLVTFQRIHNPLHLPHKTTSERPKSLRDPQFFTLLTSKCASRHNAVHFFDISTSKSAPRPPVFLALFTSKCASRHNAVHFFDISTSKTAPNPSVFNILLPNVLRATTPCTFSTSQLPKAVRRWGVLYLFTSKSASRHNGVHLFISHLPRCLRIRRFSEPTFQPSGATKPRKNTVFRDFPTFSRTCIFFLLIFSLLTLLPADCFFISPYCRKFDF